MKSGNKILNRVLLIVLAVVMAISLASCGGESGNGGGNSGEKSSDLDVVMKSAAGYLVETVSVDTLDSMGGGWVPFALSQSGTEAADQKYYDTYIDSVRVAAKNGKGVLSEERPTANERVSINLAALGVDPTDVEGFDLMKKVDDYKAISGQGLNAEIYALISANYVGYELKNEKKYFDDIIKAQEDNGSFGMDSDHPDVDMTAMAVQALSFYNGEEGRSASKAVNAKDREKAKAFIEKALAWMSSEQNDKGGYDNCEQVAQVILAIGSLGRDPVSEEAFVKDGKTLYDGLLEYYTDGAFYHADEENVEIEPDLLATEQALMALDQIKLATEGRSIFEK